MCAHKIYSQLFNQEPTMKPTTPNKEIIRRICTLFHIKECWMSTPSQGDNTQLLVSLDDEKIKSFNNELKDWSGIDFDIYTLSSKSSFTDNMKLNGIVLLPLEKNIALKDINRRSKERTQP